MKMHIVIMAAIILAAGFAYAAVEEKEHSITLPAVKTELKAGPGKDQTESFCSICHSVDYVTMQPRFSRTVWTAEVNKMIKVMGAPINEADAKVIIDYLVAEYGTGK